MGEVQQIIELEETGQYTKSCNKGLHILQNMQDWITLDKKPTHAKDPITLLPVNNQPDKDSQKILHDVLTMMTT